MKSIFRALVFSIIVVTIFSCQKKPIAAFQFNQTSYKAGDSVVLTNKSTLANTYRWTLPTGEVSTSKDLRFKLSDSLSDVDIKIKLEAFSKNRKLVDVVEQGLYVEPIKAEKLFGVMFWTKPTKSQNTNPVTVSFNYKVGYIKKFQSTEPEYNYNINADFPVFIKLQKGLYEYSAVQEAIPDDLNPQGGPVIGTGKKGSIWNGVINVDRDSIIFELPYQP